MLFIYYRMVVPAQHLTESKAIPQRLQVQSPARSSGLSEAGSHNWRKNRLWHGAEGQSANGRTVELAEVANKERW